MIPLRDGLGLMTVAFELLVCLYPRITGEIASLSKPNILIQATLEGGLVLRTVMAYTDKTVDVFMYYFSIPTTNNHNSDKTIQANRFANRTS